MTMRRAYSLIELLVVIAIISILAVISIPFLTTPADQEITTYLTTLKHTCHYLQQRALATNHLQRLIIDQQRQSISYQSGANQTTQLIPSQLVCGFLSDTKGPPSDPKEPIIQSVTFPLLPEATQSSKKQIIFSSDGTISPGTLYIIDKAATTMGALTCGISQVSYIRIYRYHQDQWQLIRT